MICSSCALAQSEPASDVYTAGCTSCKARALAAVGAHVDSQKIGSITPKFRQVLEDVFGDEWKAHATAVKDWGQRISAYRRRNSQVPQEKRHPPTQET